MEIEICGVIYDAVYSNKNSTPGKIKNSRKLIFDCNSFY